MGVKLTGKTGKSRVLLDFSVLARVFGLVLIGLTSVKRGGRLMARVKGRLLSVLVLCGLLVVVVLSGYVFADTFFTTNSTTAYNWSAGVFYQTKVVGGENVSLNASMDNETKLPLHFDGADDCDRLINNLSSYYSKIYKLDNQLCNWITNNGEKI